MNEYQRRLKQDIVSLPRNSLNAALNDPVLRVFWIFYAVIAVIVLTAEPLIAFCTKDDKRPPPEVVCPPYWKCNGPPGTRAANCECWDKY
ncbi:hypothetical protein CPZ20_15485 [Lacticaseibacillus rhamnosus]|nr:MULTISPECIES: hypothetical protein [Bacteria]MBR1038902.1 hypothetical protein [Bradyrhizobium viridifuturi]MCA3704578.1 hypothetical protein [Methylobacterium sp.]MEE4417495.1 hypothetical protein [Klebsiella pneumoniae]MQH18405.1 hypothetical protein [Escherichia coli]OYU64049.1 MAG: hypothetical protein CFE30_00075 [Bradyrhizobium sp. PARBB1]PCL27634.1 hypothetical protein CPZ20_15485 [Lacticaseibacillus rhamnosus]DAR98668.1 MAG TPA: hypothetical protein [Caudoviricetes sp.]